MPRTKVIGSAAKVIAEQFLRPLPISDEGVAEIPDGEIRRTLARGYLDLEAERDALQAFVEKISWLDPQRGPVHVHTMVEEARRLLERSE
jgi:hypothetical protein